MIVLSDAERRGALVVLLLVAIGAGYDLWRALRPRPHEVAPASQPLAATRPAAVEPVAVGDARAATASRPVDINRAEAAELDRLPGIGPVLAGRIVEQRRLHGPFRRVSELRAVRGLGPRLLERLAPLVTVGPPADSTR